MRILLLLISFSVVVSSCVNDLEKIKKVTITNTDPDERIKNLELILTEAGVPKVKVYAKLAETYHHPEEITKLKDSVVVKFYDDDGEIKTILSGKQGELLPRKQKMWLRHKVVLTNVNMKQRMETEELIWNQKDSTVFSERLVTIISPNGKFYGDGIRTKQDFTNYEFIHPRGTISND